jgi:hypothetical protein
MVLLIFKLRKEIYETHYHKGIQVHTIRNLSWIKGVSLGAHIFHCKSQTDLESKKHEYGHTIQNYILGPSYLLIIGITSETLVLLYNLKIITKKKYYKSFPEKWATALGEKYY